MAALSQDEAIALMRRGGAAVQAGDGSAALACLSPLIAAGVNQPQLWLLFGEAARLAGDSGAQERAADALLAADPAQPRALAWKGQCREGAGDRRAAAAWYRATQKALAALPSLPPSLAQLQDMVGAATARLDQGFAAAIDDGLAARGISLADCSPAFRQSLAILRGAEAATLDLQRPASYFYPGLPQRRYYEREEFAWAPALEAATDAIARELEAALADPALFKPYLGHVPGRPVMAGARLVDDPAWSALHLIKDGTSDVALAARFPATLAALAALPLCQISVRAPNVMFSLLQPGARIDPHHGAINARLICHLPLVIPGAGALSVGGEARMWERGKLLIFDDSIEHTAWNDADRDRIVLIFDIWRPEVPAADQRAIMALFETVDSYI